MESKLTTKVGKQLNTHNLILGLQTCIQKQTSIYDKNDFLLVLRRVDRYFEKCYLFFSVYFYKFNRIRSDLGLARLSSSAGRSTDHRPMNIRVRTLSPLNLGSGAQNGNVLAAGKTCSSYQEKVTAPPTVLTKRAEEWG